MAGALVSLNEGGRLINRGLSNTVGQIALEGDLGRTYGIRVERVGFAAVASDTVHFSSPSQITTIYVSSRRVELARVSVRGAQQCRRDTNEGAGAALVWSETRKALEASILSESRSRTRSQLAGTRYVRRLSPTLRIEKETVRHQAMSDRAFLSAPADELSRKGSVRDSAEAKVFYAPDASVLLSDAFSSDHCFRVARRRVRDTSYVGLAFEPVPGRTLADIRGTLWLAEDDAELRFVEFTYENLPDTMSHPEVGGRIEFARLDDGRWVVARWHIRSPRLAYVGATRVNMLASPRRLELVGFLDEGGTTELQHHTTRSIRSDSALARGVVFDSSQAGPLVGATVVLIGTTVMDSSRANGTFALRTPMSGDYTLRVSHDRLDLLGLGALQQPVRLSAGDTTHVRLVMPTVRTLVKTRCPPADSVKYPGALVVGFVLDSGTRKRVPGAAVTTRWTRPVYMRRGTLYGLGMDTSQVETATDSTGAYFVCHVPRDRPATFSANSGTAFGTARLAGDLQDSVAMLELPIVVAHSSAEPAVLRVTVRFSVPGEDSSIAEVRLPNLARTLERNAGGEYTDAALPPGPQAIVVRARGFTSVERNVVLISGDTTVVEVILTPASRSVPPAELPSDPGQPQREELARVRLHLHAAHPQPTLILHAEHRPDPGAMSGGPESNSLMPPLQSAGVRR